MTTAISRFFATCAVLIAGVCTTIMNWRFSFQLGTTPFDGYVWATFSVALDVCKWTMLGFAALTWRTHHLRALAAITIWLVATIYSFTAAIGFSATNRDTTIAERRSQTQLQATIQTMKQSPRWQSSAACADATTKSSKDFCTIYHATVAGLSEASQQEVDPQSALIARLTGLTEDQGRLLLSLSLAVACELVTALGLFAILSPSSVQRQAKSEVLKSDHPAIASITGTTPTSLTVPRWRPRSS